MERLFAYGTLNDKDIQKEISGREIAGVPDVLDGFRRDEILIEDHHYWAVVPDAASSVEGHVLELKPEELAKADDYETDAYARIPVILRSGLEAWAYLKK